MRRPRRAAINSPASQAGSTSERIWPACGPTSIWSYGPQPDLCIGVLPSARFAAQLPGDLGDLPMPAGPMGCPMPIEPPEGLTAQRPQMSKAPSFKRRAA